MSEERRNCFCCVNKRRLPGSSYISCADPPKYVTYIGGCGKGRKGTYDCNGHPNYESAEERLEEAERMAQDLKSVVRCLWPGCGYFPGYMGLNGFDSNSVFACHNFKEA